jgi:hypothetical protein
MHMSFANMDYKCNVSISQKHKCPKQNRSLQPLKRDIIFFNYLLKSNVHLHSLNNSKLTYNC